LDIRIYKEKNPVLKPLNNNSRQKNLQLNRQSLDSKGLKGVSSTSVEPDTQGKGLLGVGRLMPLPRAPYDYVAVDNSKGRPQVSPANVQKFTYIFVQYENTYIPGGDEKLYAFAVVKALSPMSTKECAIQLGVQYRNVTGLTDSEYATGSFQHPVYINQNKQPLEFRYAEIALIRQTIPGRLDNVPLGFPDFIYNPSPITTQQGILPQPPYPDFVTNQGNTGATAISVGGTVGFVDASLRNPSIVRPTSWSWNFGGTGASPTGSTAQNPTVSFNSSGTYTVTLTASNSAGSASISKTNFVTVS